MQVSATVYSQATKFSFNTENQQIVDVLKQIEESSNFRFLYIREQVDVERQVSVNAKNATVEEILNDIFAGHDVTYKVMEDNLILLSPGKNAVHSQSQLSQQQKTLSGTVTDNSGQPLPGVTVVIKGTTQGTITNADGKYLLADIPDNATLIYSFVGMKAQEILYSGQQTLNVKLTPESIGIDEVVAIGYGVQKKANLTGAVAAVNGDDLVKRPVSNTASTLQGRLPGLSVTQGTGQPGSEGIRFRVRGLGTFSGAGADPLVIIDGIAGNINTINPLDIESVSILKDAASAAIYGARAANGVILVTTKTGTKNQFKLTYDINYGVHSPTKLLDVITNSAEYMELKNEAITNSGLPDSRKYPQETIDLYKNATDRNLYPNYDWLDLIFNPALAYSHNLNFSGGTAKSSFNSSLNYTNQDGIMMGFDFEKVTFSFNSKTEITNNIRFGTNSNIFFSNTNAFVNAASDMYLSTLAQAPMYGPTIADGSGRYTFKAYGQDENNKNTYAVAKEATNNTRKYNVNTSIWLEFTLAKDLIWHTKAAVNGNFSKGKIFRPLVPQYNYLTGDFATNLNVGGTQKSLSITDKNDILTTVYSHLSYTKTINEHSFSALAGYNQEAYKYEELSGYRQGFPGNNLHEINAGASDGQTTGGTAYEWAIQSLFGRFNYNFKDRYLFEANMRYDGTSRLQTDYRWGVFPSFSAGWRISEESFMEHFTLLDNLKLRLSWGKLGNQNIGTYPYQELINLGPDYTFDNASISSGAAPSRIANRQISWEKTAVWDAGVDFSVFENKLEFNFDWYKKVTSDILRGSQVSGTLGLSAPTINDGEVTNKGIELNLTYRDQLSNGLKYSVNANFSRNRNELTKFGNEEIGETTILREGLPYGTFYLYKWIGIFQDETEVQNSPKQPYNPSPGDLKYADISGPDGKPDGQIDAHDRIEVDGAYANFEYAFNLNAEYKNFFFSAFFQGVEGIKFFVNGWGFEPFRQGSVPTTDWRNRWTETNKTNEMPKIYIAGSTPSISGLNSTYFLKDASYLRLKNIQFGYTFNQPWLEKAKISKIRLYFSGDNLLTITQYPYLDPERTSGGRFVDYPQNKIYSLGATITF
ncbi:TonB-dependent receptor [Maribellus luteus]|nr:TonB-dependent receptor [Maribellus luteus]